MTIAAPTTTRRAVSIRTAAEMYDVSQDTIRAALRSALFPRARKAGTRWLIPLSDLDSWYDQLPTE
jgi:excisionase family DNA binding protein